MHGRRSRSTTAEPEFCCCPPTFVFRRQGRLGPRGSRAGVMRLPKHMNEHFEKGRELIKEAKGLR